MGPAPHRALKRRHMPKYRRKPSNRGRWIVGLPDGNEEIIVDLARYCRTHGLNYKRLWTTGEYEGYTCRKAKEL